jgi:hypothetical protein
VTDDSQDQSWLPGGGVVVTPESGDGPVINYYFPVRIEVVGSLSDVEMRRVADHVFGELDREMTTRI